MNKLKEYLVTGSIALTCVAGTLSVGDALDVNKNYATPFLDTIRGIETAEDFAPYHAVDLETRVNEAGKRETYLEYKDGEYTQKTGVSDEGYASPGILERFDNFFQRQQAEFNEWQSYGSIEQAWDDTKLFVQHYTNELRAYMSEDNE